METNNFSYCKKLFRKFFRKKQKEVISRASRVSGGGRVSRLASSCPKDFEFEFFVYQNEVNYNVWWSSKRLLIWVRALADDTLWNCLICCVTLVGLLQVAADIDIAFDWCMAIDICFNIGYAGHALFLFFERVRQAMFENTDFTSCMKYGFVADVASYVHYIAVFLPKDARRPLKILCYYIRLHTPFEYLWALTDSNLKGSVLGTAFKYFYIFIVLRITCALIWIKVGEVQVFFYVAQHIIDIGAIVSKNVTVNDSDYQKVASVLPAMGLILSTAVPASAIANATASALGGMAAYSTAVTTTTTTAAAATSSMAAFTRRAQSRVRLVDTSVTIFANLSVRSDTETGRFIRAVYIINMMFMPIGPTVYPSTDFERITCLLIMLIGSLVVTGAAVASLALVISLYMKPEEVFRARFRLIMDEMQSTHVSKEMREKVQTFYRMYWHKQKAVSVTQLLPTFPPTLPSAIFTDIYFEAQQRSQILRDLSYQFLWELAKNMVTIHYIPGDAIIKRKNDKASVIYIAYGDIEMLTAEDDDTPILRMTRGTMISPCGGCAPMACGQALVEIRAATYCTAHVLTAANLWRVALKHGKTNGQAFIILSSFEEHFERVKRHYRGRISQNVKYKSSILQFKRNLMALKEAKDDSGNLLMTRSDYFLEIAGTYIMRNRADATLADEADEICLRPTFPCILQPSSSLLVFWHVIMSILILVVVFTHPYHIIFLELTPIQFKFFDVIISGFFTLDMIVHLSTGANVEEGVAITFTQTCTQQIQSYWFLLDVLATLPVFEFIGNGDWAGINKLLRIPKVFRVLKTLEDMSVYHSYILRFLSYTLFMIIASYILASTHQAYMCYNFEYCSVKNLTHSPFWLKSRLELYNVAQRLSLGLYYAVSMLTCTSYKSGDWELYNWQNVVYVSIILEVSTIILILMEAMYSATIMVTSAFREDYISTINDVKTFLVRNNVDSMLRKRFVTYLSLCWHTDKAYSMTHKKSIFFDLPPHVYQDIVAKQRIKYILCVPFMKYLRPEDLRQVSAKTRIFYTSPNEILQNTGDIGNEIFIIKQGICQLYDPDLKKPIRRISVRDSFGTLECLLRFPAYYTVSAVTHVQLLAVPNKYLQNALRVPQIRDAIEFAKEQGEYGRSQMRREPFMNFEPPPPTTSLYRFPLLRKFEPDTAFMQPFTRLGFFSILRYVFPRFTIRPDGNYIYRYEWIRALCALMSAFIYPSYMYAVLQVPSLYYITISLDVLAYLDIIQRMLVGYYNEDGILVSHPASTAAHYIKGAFLVDAFGCLPLEKLETEVVLSSKQREILVNPIHQLLMMNRLIQLYRLPGAMDILSNFIEREDFLLIIKAIPVFMVTINVLVCAMVFCSVTIYSELDEHGQTSWAIYPRKDLGGSWILIFKDVYRFNLTESPYNLHLAIYSWVVYEVTTTGYNIFQPSNGYLISILYLGMLLGGMMTTYFAVRVISLRANINKMLASFQEHMKDIEQFMNKENLKPKLQKDVTAYYEYNWEKTGGTDYRNVLKLCDQITLRTDAILHLYGHTFAKCPILYHCDLSLLRVVGRAVRSQYFLNETTVISKDDVLADMYFVDYGSVDVRESKEILRSEARLPRGSVFGNLEHASAIRSPTDIVVTGHCHLLQINTLMFYEIILDFPTVTVLMKKYRPNNENYIIGGIGEGSSLMNRWKEHRTPSSPMIVVSRKGVSNYFNVNSRACQIYLVLVSLAVMYLDIYNAGFQSNNMVIIMFLYFFDVAFLLKIPLSYIQPYVVTKGDQRIALIENRKNYFKSEIYYDVASCLPLEVFCLLAGSHHTWRVFSMLRLNRLLRVVTIRSCLKRHQAKLNINLVLSTLAGVFIWFSLFIHTTTCLLYTVGVLQDGKKPHSSWMYKDDGTPHCHNQYVCSIYMVLTTFGHKGVGDVVAKNKLEVLFMTILEIISTMMFMIYVGEFSNIIQYQSFRSFGYYCKFLELQDFLSNNRVSKNLVKLVSRYTLHLWRESRGVQIPYFLETAPPCFKLKVMSSAYMQHLIMHPSFKNCEPAFLRQLVGCLTLFRYNTDLFVVKEGEITDSMYLVHNGRVVEVDEDMDDETNEFTPGSHFGQIQGIIRDTPFNYSYKTTSKAEVLTLSLNKWEHLLEHFPYSRYLIFKNYPNHPYSRHPHDTPKQKKDKPLEDKKRQMMARRKTEHELKAMPILSPKGQRDLSPSESETYYRPFYTPSTMSTAIPMLGRSAPKVPGVIPTAALGGPAIAGAAALAASAAAPPGVSATKITPTTLSATRTMAHGDTSAGPSSATGMKVPGPATATGMKAPGPASAIGIKALGPTSATGMRAPGPTSNTGMKEPGPTSATDIQAPSSALTIGMKAPGPDLATVMIAPRTVSETEAVSSKELIATKPTLVEGSDKITVLEMKKLKDTLALKLEAQGSSFAPVKTASDGRLAPRPTSVMKRLEDEPLEEMDTDKANKKIHSKANLENEKTELTTEDVLVDKLKEIPPYEETQHKKTKEGTMELLPDKKQPFPSTIEIYGPKETHISDERDSLPSHIKTTEVLTTLPSLPSDDKEDFLPGRGITRTKIFEPSKDLTTLSDNTQMAPKVSDEKDEDTNKAAVISDETDDSMTRFLQQISDTKYVAELLSPTSTSESKSIAIPAFREDKIDKLEELEVPQTPDVKVKPPEVVRISGIPVESKTPLETSMWPLDSKSEKQVDEKKSFEEVISPIKNEPSQLPTRQKGELLSESLLKNEPSLPYLDFNADHNSNKKEEEKVSEEKYEEAPTSFMRRMTRHAKSFVGRPSVSQKVVTSNDNIKDASMLEQEIKATSALLEKYEERSKKFKAPGSEDGGKSLLAQYIEKRDAELAVSQQKEPKEEEREEEFVRAPRRSIVVFDEDEPPPVRTIPIDQTDDDDETVKLSRAPRRSVVIFDSEGKPPNRVLPQQETNDDEDELDKKRIPAIAIREGLNENKEYLSDSATAKPTSVTADSFIKTEKDFKYEAGFLIENDQHAEIALAQRERSFINTDKSKDIDTKPVQEVTKSVDDKIVAKKDAADDYISATAKPASEPASVKSSSSLKKREVKPSLFESLFRKKKPKNKPEDHEQTSSATPKTFTGKDQDKSDTSDDNEDYDNKLTDYDEWRTDKRMTHVRYVGEKDEEDELPLLEDEEVGPSKPLPPQRKLSGDDKRTNDMTENEKKFIMMDSDVDSTVGQEEKDKNKET